MGNFVIDRETWYSNLPDFELEGLWGMVIQNGVSNTFTDIPDNFDNYVKSVSIPQLTLEAENTSFGMINYTGKSPYGDVTLEFYDDIWGNAMNFFQNWLGSIFDDSKNAFKENWRYEDKDIFVEYYRHYHPNKDIESFRGRTHYNNYVPITRYHLVRCLPKSISDISAEEGGGDRKTFSVTLATQKVITETNAGGMTGVYGQPVDTEKKIKFVERPTLK